MVEGKNARKQVAKILDVASRHTGSIAEEIKKHAAQALVNVDLLILDAQRYQWLREQEWFQCEIDDRYQSTTNLQAQDKVIDDAMATQSQPKQ